MCTLVTVLVIVFYSSPHTVSSQDEVIGFLIWTVDGITALRMTVDGITALRIIIMTSPQC